VWELIGIKRRLRPFGRELRIHEHRSPLTESIMLETAHWKLLQRHSSDDLTSPRFTGLRCM